MKEDILRKLKEKKDQGEQWFKGERSKYIIVILVSIGLLVLLWPSPARNTDTEAGGSPITETRPLSAGGHKEKMIGELESILANVSGAGQVKVNLTLSSEGVKTYATNERVERRDIDENDSVRTVKKTAEESSNKDIAVSGGSPLLVEDKTPEVIGVLVVAQGAKDAAVKEELIKATATLLNISYNKVEVVAKQGGNM
ncbi:MAG: hypothetical protein LBR98_10105 [Syntrophomonadaceae bacterium]|jgi:stage III sporulation protein AG|nr:hypothetical protein [Syntrophomonadaceae bacterium]